MALIALRKTADEGKRRYPDAARVLTKNTYIDDICDSVHFVKQARQLTSETDKVLHKGKFHVKG